MTNLVYNIRTTWSGLLDDIKKYGFKYDGLFTKDDRLLYIGITIILLAIVIYAYDIMMGKDEEIRVVRLSDLKDLK